MTSMRVSATSLIANALVVGDTGLGVEGINIPSTGTNGASVLFQYVNSPADDDAEFRWLITSLPSVGTLDTFEDGSFKWTAPVPTVDVIGYGAYKDGVLIENTVVNIQIGPEGVVSIAVSETFNGFTETINAGIAGSVSLTVSETFDGFSESINTMLSSPISVSITEVFDGFSESINLVATEPGTILLTVTETFSGFSEIIAFRTPSAWVDKIPATANWTDKQTATIIWTDKPEV